MPTHDNRALLKHGPSMMLKQCPSNAIYVTNERNSRTTTYLEHQSHVSQRAQGVAKFRPAQRENSRPAALRADLRTVHDA